MLASKPLIVVAGATGSQGGSTIRFLLKDGSYRIRAITRKPDSPKAQELKKKGVDVVQADFENKSSLVAAFKGAHGVFGVTQFWETFSLEKEAEQGKNLIKAAIEASVSVFVWSSLDHAKPSHWESKALVADYLKTTSLDWTIINTTFYYENLFGVMGMQWTGKEFHLRVPAFPNNPIPMYTVEDTGAYVVASLKDRAKYSKKTLSICAEWISIREIAETFTKVSGEPMTYTEFDKASFDAVKNEGWRGAEDFYENMKLFMENGPETGFRTTKDAFEIYPQAQTWADVVKNNMDRISAIKLKAV